MGGFANRGDPAVGKAKGAGVLLDGSRKFVCAHKG
jgi:hypothetical protein